MTQRTSIEWTDCSCNALRARRRDNGKVGHHCVVHSPGCLHCYSGRWNRWVGTGLPFTASSSPLVEMFVDDRPLHAMRRMKTPRKVFMLDMTDLFQSAVADRLIDRIFAGMLLAHQHVKQVLTKRPERMLEYLSASDLQARLESQAADLLLGRDRINQPFSMDPPFLDAPFPGIWLGVSVEDRRHGLPRIDVLRKVPAVVRFLSIEPLLEDLGAIDLTGIDWVIVGGESGPGARPMHLDWARSVRDQCIAQGVAYFFKQHGQYQPVQEFDSITRWINKAQGWVGKSDVCLDAAGKVCRVGKDFESAAYPVAVMRRVGKKAGGRTLDGRTWDQLPATVEAR